MKEKLMSKDSTSKNLNDLIHLNSYLIFIQKPNKEYVRVNFTLELPELPNRGSYLLAEIYGKREKFAQKFLFEKINIEGIYPKKGQVFYIDEISANLMVSETIWNYDQEKGKLGSHSISVSDFY